MKQSMLDKDCVIVQLGKDKEHLENSCIEKQRDIDEVKVTVDSTNRDKKSLEVELSIAKIQMENSQQLYSESMKQQNTIANNLRRVTDEHLRASKQFVDMQAAYETLQTQHKTETEQLRKEGTQSRNRVLALEKTLNESSENYQQERLESTERELTLKSQCEDLESNMIKQTKSLQRTDEDLESEKCLRQTERNNMMEKISQLTEQIAESETLRNDFDQKLESAETENIENKIRLEAAKDDKDKLLEKIIQLENNLKKQNDGFTKKCREFDQLQSAILDLGRENQSLQITKDKITNRLWIIDDEALECHNCHKLFSLTHRKHHCRNCGQVFCQDCSTKTATLAVSRNPVRVCDGCHLEVNSHRRNSSAQSSEISLTMQN